MVGRTVDRAISDSKASTRHSYIHIFMTAQMAGSLASTVEFQKTSDKSTVWR